MRQHEVYRLPDGAFTTTRIPPRRLPPRERYTVGEEDLPPERYRIPLTSTPESAPEQSEGKKNAPPDE